MACIIKYLLIYYNYAQLKAYFMENLDSDHQYLVNYRGHCNAHAGDGASMHPFSWYWKNELEFQAKRNLALNALDDNKAESLIISEQQLCDYEIILFFMIITWVLSFYNLS